VTSRRRKISTTRRPIKATRLAAALAAASVGGAALAGGGCAAPVAEAPFPVRPDTVLPGDPRGPFDGRVLDADSGKPVDGATVLASWAFETGRGLVGPAGSRAVIVETDADGRYRVDRAPAPADGRWRIARFTLVVWKQGYLGWRSDRRFADLARRHDFAQTGAEVRLEPLRPDAPIARHLAFIGIAGPLLTSLDEALLHAPAELAAAATRPAPAAPGHAALDPGVLLSVDELKAVTRYDGAFTVAPLPDVPPNADYGSLHFKAVGKSERFDAAIRVYRFPNPSEDLGKRFEALLTDLPNAREADEVGDRSLRAREQNPDGDTIYAVAALDRAERALVVFTCGEGLCPDFDTAVGLVRRMVPRLGRLARPAAVEGSP